MAASAEFSDWPLPANGPPEHKSSYSVEEAPVRPESQAEAKPFRNSSPNMQAPTPEPSAGIPDSHSNISDGSDYTLKATVYTPKPRISIPKPHLPLRKRASQELRIRTSRDVDVGNMQDHQSLAQMAQSLRPETVRWSKDSIQGESFATIGSSMPQRPHTAQETTTEEEADTLSPLLRPATAVSDFTFSNVGHRSMTLSENQDKSSALRMSTASSPRAPTFWRDGGASSIRESILSSTYTDSSSAANTSSTSVWTARSSRTTYDSPTTEYPKVSDDELSVDDCIAMYEEGFRDDPRPKSRLVSAVPPVPPMPESRRISPEALLQQGKTLPVPPEAAEPSKVEQPTEAAPESTRSSDTLTDAAKTPTSEVPSPTSQRRPPKVPRDFYGTKQESTYVTLNRYRAWHREYTRHLDRRKRKWVYLMNSHGLPSQMFPEKFPPRSKDVKRYVRKGIPPEWRGAAWFFYGDGASFLTANAGLYERLLKQIKDDDALPEQCRDIIERDLHRTFPENEYFKPDASSVLSTGGAPIAETSMIKSLRRILQAYAVYHPQVGYCQSLNFLAGHLLLFMKLSFRSGNYEERAFAMLCILTEKYLPGTHSVALEGCNVDIGVLMTILQETMPSLWQKLDSKERIGTSNTGRKYSQTSATLKAGTEDLPVVSLVTTAWFMSCFVGTLPIETACRVWDCLWYEGSKTIFRVALAIFKLGEKQITSVSDPMDVFNIVQTLPRGLLDANELMEIATMKSGKSGISRLRAGTPGFGGLSQSTVESRREERRAFAKVEKEDPPAVSGQSASGQPQMPPTPPPSAPPPGGGGLKRSMTRGTLKRLKSFKKIA